MTAPVLQDLMGVDFTEGDRVVYAAANGIRVGKVEWIKELNPQNNYGATHRVYIDLSEHHDKDGPAKLTAQKMGYNYRKDKYKETYQYFLKV